MLRDQPAAGQFRKRLHEDGKHDCAQTGIKPMKSMETMRHYCGVIGELIAGRWHNPKTGQKRTVPVESIVIADTLEGSESALIEHVHPGKAIAVVSDERTRAVLGERILR